MTSFFIVIDSLKLILCLFLISANKGACVAQILEVFLKEKAEKVSRETFEAKSYSHNHWLLSRIMHLVICAENLCLKWEEGGKISGGYERGFLPQRTSGQWMSANK